MDTNIGAVPVTLSQLSSIYILANGSSRTFREMRPSSQDVLLNQSKDHPINALIIVKNIRSSAGIFWGIYFWKREIERACLKSSSEHDFAVTCYFLSWLVCHHWADWCSFRWWRKRLLIYALRGNLLRHISSRWIFLKRRINFQVPKIRKMSIYKNVLLLCRSQGAKIN